MFVASAIIISLIPGLSATSARSAPTAERQVEAACEAVRQVHSSRLQPVPEIGSAGFQEQARIGRLMPSANQTPLIKIRISYSGPGFTPTDTIWAWKGQDGAWLVSRASDQEISGPHLPWPLDAELNGLEAAPLSRWHLVEGSVGPEAAETLDLLVGSDCLESEPAFRPLNVPLRSGQEQRCSWHPTSTLLEIRRGGKRRTLVRLCNNYLGPEGSTRAAWLSDAIVELVRTTDLKPLNSGHRHEVVPAVPEGFRGKSSQDPDLCDNAAQITSLGATAFTTGDLYNEITAVERLSRNVVRIKAVGPGVIEAGPQGDFEQLLLLSPDGTRLAFGQLPLLYHRCA